MKTRVKLVIDTGLDIDAEEITEFTDALAAFTLELSVADTRFEIQNWYFEREEVPA